MVPRHAPRPDLMRLALMLAAIILMGVASGVSIAQPGGLGLPLNPVDWDQWETPLSPSQKRSLLASAVPHPRPLDHYHFVDFSGDGLVDIIMNGSLGEEIEPVSFHKNEGEGAFSIAFEGSGVVTALHRSEFWLPLGFSLLVRGCCDDFRDFIEVYAPSPQRDSLRYEPTRSLAWASWTLDAEAKPFAEPIPFVVMNEHYNLRHRPEIDDEVHEGIPHFDEPVPGNVFARYARGTRGMAIAERRGTDGRAWWLVLIEPEEKPLWSLWWLNSMNSDRTPALMGWMSSRYLERAPLPEVP